MVLVRIYTIAETDISDGYKRFESMTVNVTNDRRTVLKTVAAAGAGAGLLSSSSSVSAWDGPQDSDRELDDPPGTAMQFETVTIGDVTSQLEYGGTGFDYVNTIEIVSISKTWNYYEATGEEEDVDSVDMGEYDVTVTASDLDTVSSDDEDFLGAWREAGSESGANTEVPDELVSGALTVATAPFALTTQVAAAMAYTYLDGLSDPGDHEYAREWNWEEDDRPSEAARYVKIDVLLHEGETANITVDARDRAREDQGGPYHWLNNDTELDFDVTAPQPHG